MYPCADHPLPELPTMLRTTNSHRPAHPATVAIRLGAVLALAIAGLLALPGCNIVGPIAILVAGPPKDEAKFELDKTKTTVIFIDDRAGVLRQRIIRDRIGIAAEKQLLAKGLVTDMIQGQLAQVAARQDRNRQLLSIAAIGRACQAEVVIYADVADYSITPDGAAYKPNAVLKIKIIDAKTEARIFPGPDAPLDHYPLTVSFKDQTRPLPGSFTERVTLEQSFADQVGLALAQVFYEHELTEKPGGTITETRPTGK